MARNFKKDYIQKLLAVKTSNGFTVDVRNYLHNPNHRYEYPPLHKVVSEDEKGYKICSVFYFKYYNGTGEYVMATHTQPKETEGTWYVVKDKKETTLESSDRFSLAKLIRHAESVREESLCGM